MFGKVDKASQFTDVVIAREVVVNDDNNNPKLTIENQERRRVGVLKYVSLALLTTQYVAASLVMRHARTRCIGTSIYPTPGISQPNRYCPLFATSVAVAVSEVLKLVGCLFVMLVTEGGPLRLCRSIRVNILQQPRDCGRVCVPAVIFVLQGNLTYVAISNLSAPVVQVLQQQKIVATAIFAVIILRRTLCRTQWLSLFVLVMGVSLVLLHTTGRNVGRLQMSSILQANRTSGMEVHVLDEAKMNSEQNSTWTENSRTFARFGKSKEIKAQSPLLGVAACTAGAVLSGFSGTYFELLLKTTQQSLWLRNVQLSFLGVLFGVAMAYAKDGQQILEYGILHGFDWIVWVVVILQSAGGVLVALAIKYADNILKAFACSLAIVISAIVSALWSQLTVTPCFALGTSLTVCSVLLYSQGGLQSKEPWQREEKQVNGVDSTTLQKADTV